MVAARPQRVSPPRREAFEQGEYGYRTILRALVPVQAYTLKVVIDDASGYELDRWMAEHEGTPFSGTCNPPRQSMGSCGLGIIRRRYSRTRLDRGSALMPLT